MSTISLTIGPVVPASPDADDKNLTVIWDKDKPLDPLTQRFVEEKCVGGALFTWDCETEQFCSPAPDISMLRLLFDEDRIDSRMTPAMLDMEDGDHILVTIGCGGGPGQYPSAEEVFNSREGALKYYQLESRRQAKRSYEQEKRIRQQENRIAELEEELEELREKKAKKPKRGDK